VVSGIEEFHANTVALPDANGRARNAAVVGPRREFHPRHNFDRLIPRDERVGAQCLPVRQQARCAAVEIRQDVAGIEAVPRVIHLAHETGHGRAVARVRRGQGGTGIPRALESETHRRGTDQTDAA
jgi:hypothetical protein